MKRLTLAVIGCLVFLPFVVQAHTPIDGVTVGMLPQSPWFPLKLVGEQVATFFTFSATMKFERELRLAGLRLSETQAMCEDAESCQADELMARYEQQLTRVQNAASHLPAAQQQAASEKIITALEQHDVVFGELQESAPKDAQETFSKATAMAEQSLGHAFSSIMQKLAPELQKTMTEKLHLKIPKLQLGQ